MILSLFKAFKKTICFSRLTQVLSKGNSFPDLASIRFDLQAA